MSDIARILVETTIRQALKEMKTDTKRSTRNLIDMALNFSGGRFQKHFLETAQEMLCNEESAYYELIKDVVSNVDTERLIQVGMNIGYNSCTAGAKLIRNIEEQFRFNVPWNLSLVMDGGDYPAVMNAVRVIICEGKQLGIYTWMIHTTEMKVDMLRLFAEHNDCAFLVFVSGENITEQLLRQADSFMNLLFVVKWDKYAQAACAQLRKNGFPYAVYVPYEEKEVENILNGTCLLEIEKVHPIFALFRAKDSVLEQVKMEVYQYIRNARIQQKNAVIPMDLVYDNRLIDSIISTEACTASFDRKGQLYSVFGQTEEAAYNYYQNSLRDILRKAFPKKGIET